MRLPEAKEVIVIMEVQETVTAAERLCALLLRLLFVSVEGD